MSERVKALEEAVERLCKEYYSVEAKFGERIGIQQSIITIQDMIIEELEKQKA